MKYIISYDITNDKKRAKIAKKLEACGVRLQYSLFECDLTVVQLARLSNDLKSLINRNADSVMYFPLCGRCNAARKSEGVEKVIIPARSVIA